jgi:hypothetical protein
MMGDRQVQQDALFYEFSLERHAPENHLLRAIDRFVDLKGVRAHLAPFYSDEGRPSIDPELLIRMLIVGYCFGIRSERRLCEEVHLNLAYRWFCRLGLDGSVPLQSVAGSHYSAGVTPYLPLLPLITDQHVNALTLAGTIEEVTEHVVLLCRAGVDEIIIRPFAPEGGTIEETIASFASRVWPQVRLDEL